MFRGCAMGDFGEGSPRMTSLRGAAVLNRRHWTCVVLEATRNLEHSEVRSAIVN